MKRFARIDIHPLSLFGIIFFSIAAGILVPYFLHIRAEYFGPYSEGPSWELFPMTKNVIPGCSRVTVKDLLSLFPGTNSRSQLAQAMVKSKVPVDITISDNNAPLIATYLVNASKANLKVCTH